MAGAALVATMAGCGGPTAAPPETQSLGQRAQATSAVSWGRFRGPNGSGVADDAGPLPTRFDPDTNVVWTTPLPPGHSSPVISGSDLVLTAVEAERLLTIGLDRANGGARR